MSSSSSPSPLRHEKTTAQADLMSSEAILDELFSAIQGKEDVEESDEESSEDSDEEEEKKRAKKKAKKEKKAKKKKKKKEKKKVSKSSKGKTSSSSKAKQSAHSVSNREKEEEESDWTRRVRRQDEGHYPDLRPEHIRRQELRPTRAEPPESFLKRGRGLDEHREEEERRRRDEEHYRRQYDYDQCHRGEDRWGA